MMARRTFLAVSGCAAAGTMSPTPTPVRNSSLIWQVNSDLLAEESALGFHRVLPESVIRRTNDLSSPAHSCCVIVPACQQLTPVVCNELRRRCEAGSLVLTRECIDLCKRFRWPKPAQTILEKYFGMTSAETPSPTKPAATSRFIGRSEYSVRNFGGRCALSGGTPVGAFGTAVVAQRSVFGRGQLVLLSSLLGPNLLAADTQAHAWLQAVLRAKTDNRSKTDREKEV